MGKIEKKRMSLLYLLNKFLTSVLKCLTNQDFSKRKNTVHNLLTLIDNYNQMLASDPTVAPTSYPAHSTAVQSVLHKNKYFNFFVYLIRPKLLFFKELSLPYPRKHLFSPELQTEGHHHEQDPRDHRPAEGAHHLRRDGQVPDPGHGLAAARVHDH